MVIHRKIVVDEDGNPQEVIIPWDEFQEIVEMLGLDLNEGAIEDLNQARKDRVGGNLDAYIDLSDL
ncbi:MAG: hypothetical protein ACE10K_14185 [Rhodothermales bacterium]